MKKIIFIVCLFFGLQAMQAQLDFGIKAGVNYNSESIKEASQDIFSGAESKTGYHAGIWLRAEIPVLGLYIRPELVYSELKNELTYTPSGSGGGALAKKTDYNFRKLDVPVLLGTKTLGFLHLYGGPSFQYILDSDFGINDIKDIESDGFSLGLQFGAGVEFGKLGIDVRWERALTDSESSFVDDNVGNVNFDTRVNQVIVGLTYKF